MRRTACLLVLVSLVASACAPTGRDDAVVDRTSDASCWALTAADDRHAKHERRSAYATWRLRHLDPRRLDPRRVEGSPSAAAHPDRATRASMRAETARP
ncbi:hypothetical protein [Nocardioides scoriae]|uniref:hypothetical protein n=1 Tax=Nocardioides scoriae TaxID=642780 RepID=UPI000B89CF21|nr:hypothetical protein [Nocardioides scoriae]